MKRRWLIKLKRLFAGIEITTAVDRSSDERSSHQLVARVRIKRWYMPLFALKALRQQGIPARYWLLFYWQYYTKRGVSNGN